MFRAVTELVLRSKKVNKLHQISEGRAMSPAFLPPNRNICSKNSEPCRLRLNKRNKKMGLRGHISNCAAQRREWGAYIGRAPPPSTNISWIIKTSAFLINPLISYSHREAKSKEVTWGKGFILICLSELRWKRIESLSQTLIF